VKCQLISAISTLVQPAIEVKDSVLLFRPPRCLTTPLIAGKEQRKKFLRDA
jgi:hypothetical protein